MVRMIGLPKTVRSPKGIEVDLSGRYTARIDTNNISPGEGGFHIHVYKDEIEVSSQYFGSQNQALPPFFEKLQIEVAKLNG